MLRTYLLFKARRLVLFAALASLMLLALTSLRASAAPSSTIVVTTAADESTNGDGCSLREAIANADDNAVDYPDCAGGVGFDTITFDIGGGGPQTINLAVLQNPLNITDPVTIDGTTQPGCASYPCIDIDGSTSSSSMGLTIYAGNSVVRGLDFTGFTEGAGIDLESNGGNVIVGNFMGTDITGNTARPNMDGIQIDSPNNRIGGTTHADRNLISGNWQSGIYIPGFSGPAGGNLIEGNFIGTDVNGTGKLPNGQDGIAISTPQNVIGGTSASARNVISGNTQNGIFIQVSSGNVVEGNYIGVDKSGKLALGNGANGVFIQSAAANNLIGGTGPGAANTIAYNGANGVAIGKGKKDAKTIGNAIRRNRIFNNTGLGIDLADNGVTPNDPGDVDTGPNNLQNMPYIGGATSSTQTIVGKLNSTAHTTFTIEFFANGFCNGSGHGEGKRYLGSLRVTTGGKGNASFSFVATNPFSANQVISATATDSNGNTSEFAACRTAA